MKKKNGGEIIDNAYFELVRRFPLKPIASDRELDRAIQTVNELVDRGFENLTHGEEAYLDVLSDLVEKYENAHHSIPDASPVEMLKFFIEDRNTNQRAVALGSGIATSTMSEILAGRRRMRYKRRAHSQAMVGVRDECLPQPDSKWKHFLHTLRS